MSRGNVSLNFGCAGMLNLLQVAFIILKIVGIQPIATWSWWFVLVPIWIQLGFVIVTFLLIFISYILSNL